MRGQSSIEFLSTYSFLFIMLGILASFLFYFATLPRSSIPMSCTSFSGPACSMATYYANSNKGYSIFVLALSNSQSIPINITSITVTVRSFSYTGYCSPTMLYPGTYTICVAGANKVNNLGTLIQGFYTINAKACNSGLASFSQSCSESISYSGSFTTGQASKRPSAYAVIIAAGPMGKTIPSYQSYPLVPSNWTVVGNGYWSTYPNGYAYTSTPQYSGTYLGFKLSPFPQTTSILNGNALCTPPYNSVLAIASTVFYMPTSANVGVNITTAGAEEIYYEEPSSNVWLSTFGGAAWKLQGPTKYSSTIGMNNGAVRMQIFWASNCFGMQALNLTNLPQ
jgi:hypothetical protein